eukprot:gene81-829_t
MQLVILFSGLIIVGQATFLCRNVNCKLENPEGGRYCDSCGLPFNPSDCETLTAIAVGFNSGANSPGRSHSDRASPKRDISDSSPRSKSDRPRRGKKKAAEPNPGRTSLPSLLFFKTTDLRESTSSREEEERRKSEPENLVSYANAYEAYKRPARQRRGDLFNDQTQQLMQQSSSSASPEPSPNTLLRKIFATSPRTARKKKISTFKDGENVAVLLKDVD